SVCPLSVWRRRPRPPLPFSSMPPFPFRKAAAVPGSRKSQKKPVRQPAGTNNERPGGDADADGIRRGSFRQAAGARQTPRAAARPSADARGLAAGFGNFAERLAGLSPQIVTHRQVADGHDADEPSVFFHDKAANL